MSNMNESDKDSLLRCWNNMFRMGSRKLLVEIMGLKPSKDETEDWDDKKINDKWNEFLLQSQIYISKLLKAENLSFLFGAGSSIPLGGITIRNIPLELEYQIHESLGEGSKETKLLYEILEYLMGTKPFSQTDVKVRAEAIGRLITEGNSENMKKQEIKITLEGLLSFMYCLKSGLVTPSKNKNDHGSSSILSLKRGKEEIEIRLDILDDLISTIKREYFSLLSKLPEPSIANPLNIHKQFLKKILTRPLNLRRPKIFTTNNDLLIENAMDELGIMYLDGFIGTTRRTFL